VSISPTETAGSAPTRRFASPLLPIFLVVAVDVLGMTLILPLLPFYTERLGASPTVVGALVSVFAVCQLISGPYLGRLSDRIGRRPALLISQVGTLIGFIVLAVAHQVWLVFVSRMIDGATAGNLTIAQAYISDVSAPENRAKSFAIIGIAFGFGFMVGPGISGFLASFNYLYPIIAAAVLSFISILCTYFLLPRTKPAEETPSEDPGPGGRRLSIIQWSAYGKFFAQPDMRRLLTRWFLFAFSFSSFVSAFALFAERRYTWHGHPFGVREVGYAFALSGFLGIIMQGGMVGRMVKWMGEQKLVRFGFLISGLCYAAFGFSYHIWSLVTIMVISGIGGSGLRPALTSMITQKAGRREQGVVIGLTQSLTSVAQIAAPLLAGKLIDMHMLATWAVLTGVVALAALFF
jgi:DHA1 family tetracycline resistance protein-like MFS transporter